MSNISGSAYCQEAENREAAYASIKVNPEGQLQTWWSIRQVQSSLSGRWTSPESRWLWKHILTNSSHIIRTNGGGMIGWIRECEDDHWRTGCLSKCVYARQSTWSWIEPWLNSSWWITAIGVVRCWTMAHASLKSRELLLSQQSYGIRNSPDF